MAEMKVECTADGRDILYRVHVHPEFFNWLTVSELRSKMTTQFEAHLEGVLYDIKEETQ